MQKITLGAVAPVIIHATKRGFPSKQGTDLRDHQPRRGTCRRGRFTDQRYSAVLPIIARKSPQFLVKRGLTEIIKGAPSSVPDSTCFIVGEEFSESGKTESKTTNCWQRVIDQNNH